MSSGIRLRSVPGYNGRQDFCLTISVDHLLDSMHADERREFIGYAVSSGELLKVVCRQVAAGHAGPNADPAADFILDDRTITDMRQALMPLLSESHADEMASARKEADECRSARDLLRGLVHIAKLRQEAGRDGDMIASRNEQYSEQWRMCCEMFPDVAPELPKESVR